MARKLVELGVDTIEAGFPIASDGDFEAVVAVSREVSDVGWRHSPGLHVGRGTRRPRSGAR